MRKIVKLFQSEKIYGIERMLISQALIFFKLLMVIILCKFCFKRIKSLYLNRNWENMIQHSEIFSHSNPRTRSFLSPSQKFGCRSLSTSDCQATLQKTASSDYNSWKAFKNSKQKSNHQKSNIQLHKDPKIKLGEFQKKNETLIIQKNSKMKPHFDNYYIKDNDRQNQQNINSNSKQLHVLIKQMKQKIRLLQKQNLMLRQQQIQDISLIRKQNQVVYELQNVIKELSIRQESVKKLLETLKMDKKIQASPLQCIQCHHYQKKNFELLSKDASHQLAQIVCKLKEERDFYRKQIFEFQKKIQSLMKENYAKSKKIQEMLSTKCLPQSYLQLCTSRNLEINAIQALLNDI